MSTQEQFEALKIDGDICFWGRPSPRCPHCGHSYDVSKHDAWHIYAEGTHDLSCPSCDLDFKVRTSVRHSFTTDSDVQKDD
jgi:transposase-like protein